MHCPATGIADNGCKVMHKKAQIAALYLNELLEAVRSY